MAHTDADSDEDELPPVAGTYGDSRPFDVWAFIHRKNREVDVEQIIAEGGVDDRLAELHPMVVRHAPDLVKPIVSRMKAIGQRPGAIATRDEQTRPESEGDERKWSGWVPTKPTPTRG